MVTRPATPGTMFLAPPAEARDDVGLDAAYRNDHISLRYRAVDHTCVPRRVVPRKASLAGHRSRVLPPQPAQRIRANPDRELRLGHRPVDPEGGDERDPVQWKAAGGQFVQHGRRISATGVGRLPSSTTRAHRTPGATRSRSRGVSIGSARARRTSAAVSATNGGAAGSSIPATTHPGGRVMLNCSSPREGGGSGLQRKTCL